MNYEYRALSLSYVHCKMLLDNLDVLIHERKVSGKSFKRAEQNYEKLRVQSKNTFKAIEELIDKSEEKELISKEIDSTFAELWNREEV